MAEAQILTPVPGAMDGSANRLPTPGLGGRLAPLTQFVRQPAVQRALPTIAMASAIGIAALAYFTMQAAPQAQLFAGLRSEEHTSELQSLMRSSYAVFCLKKQKKKTTKQSRQIKR